MTAVSDGGEELSDILVSLIDPNPAQPRKHFEPGEIRRLGQSLKRHGLKQYPRVIAMEGGRYQLLGGERRLRAAIDAELPTLRCIVISGRQPTEKEMLLDQIVDNQDRENLVPGDLAASYQRFMDLSGWSSADTDKLAKEIDRSKEHVEDTLRMLRLPADVLDLANSGALPRSYASKIAKLPDHDSMRALAKRKVRDELTMGELLAILRKRGLGGGPIAGRKNRIKRGTRLTISTRRRTRVTVISSIQLEPIEIAEALFDALRQQTNECGREFFPENAPEEMPRLTPQVLLDLLESFRLAGPDVSLAAAERLEGVALLFMTQMLDILRDPDPQIRGQAVQAMNGIPAASRLAISHFMTIARRLANERE